MKNGKMKNGRGLSCKITLLVLMLYSLSGLTSIASQNSLNTDSRPITYTALGEFAKYVHFKEKADSLFLRYENELQEKTNLLDISNEKVLEYENFIIPSLESKIEIMDTINSNQKKIFSIQSENQKAELKNARRGGWQKLGAGILVGILVGLFAGT